jgi:hypothetical protein
LRNARACLKIPAMKFRGVSLGCVVAVVFITACVHEHNPPPPAPVVVPAAPPQVAPPQVAPPSTVPPPIVSKPVFVPDYSRGGQPLPNGIFAWDALIKAVDAVQGQDFARFTFNFTNISGGNVTILNVKPGCGCTTAELPPVPRTITPATVGTIK